MIAHDFKQTHANRVTDISGDPQLAEQTFQGRLTTHSDITPLQVGLRCPGRIAVTFCEAKPEAFNNAHLTATAVSALVIDRKSYLLDTWIKPHKDYPDDPHLIIREAAPNRYQAVVISELPIADRAEQQLAINRIRTTIFLHEKGLNSPELIDLMADFRGDSYAASPSMGVGIIESADYQKHLADTGVSQGKTTDLSRDIVSTLFEAIPQGLAGARATIELSKELKKLSGNITDATMTSLITKASAILSKLAERHG